jgi:hypothetical protein
MQFRAALPVAVRKVVKKGVARKDHRSRPATVPGRPSGQRAVPKVQQFPFALGRTVPARRPPVLARRVPAHPGEQHAVQQAVLGQAVFGEVLEEVLEELLAAVEVTTGRVREAMQNLADPPAQTRDRNAAAKGRVHPLRQAPGRPNRGRGLVRHPVDRAVGPAGSQVGNRASHRHASAGANQAGKNQEHDS